MGQHLYIISLFFSYIFFVVILSFFLYLLSNLWMEVEKIDLRTCNLFKDLAQDRLECWNIIHVTDPNIVGTRLWWWWRIDDDDDDDCPTWTMHMITSLVIRHLVRKFANGSSLWTYFTLMSLVSIFSFTKMNSNFKIFCTLMENWIFSYLLC